MGLRILSLIGIGAWNLDNYMYFGESSFYLCEALLNENHEESFESRIGFRNCVIFSIMHLSSRHEVKRERKSTHNGSRTNNTKLRNLGGCQLNGVCVEKILGKGRT